MLRQILSILALLATGAGANPEVTVRTFGSVGESGFDALPCFTKLHLKFGVENASNATEALKGFRFEARIIGCGELPGVAWMVPMTPVHAIHLLMITLVALWCMYRRASNCFPAARKLFCSGRFGHRTVAAHITESRISL